MGKSDGKMVAVRLDAGELDALEKLARVAKLPSISEAMRLAIRLAPAGLAAQTIERVDELAAQVRALADGLEAATKPLELDALFAHLRESNMTMAEYFQRHLDTTAPSGGFGKDDPRKTKAKK